MNEFKLQCKLMGSAFEFIVVANDSSEADVFLNAGMDEMKRIEELLSEFKPTSETSRINSIPANEIFTIDSEVHQLLQRCQKLYSISQGAFDVSMAPLKKLYSFKRTEEKLPSSDDIQCALQKTGFNNILLLDNNRICLLKKEMKISFAAIGKGYAADKVQSLWRQMGVTGGVINASGDISVLGNRADGRCWSTGISNTDRTQLLHKLQMPSVAVATSGDYEQYFVCDGKRYSHTLHPKTGLPVHGIRSVTVFSPSAELSDALATAVNVMGVNEGKHFIQQLPQTWYFILDEKNNIHSNLPA
ncbi:MAG: FAD:protein FMN transferase [Bdellovibrionales bacterium]